MGPLPGTTTNNKLRRVIIHFELLHELFKEGPHPPHGYNVIRDPMPADARLVNVQHAWPNSIELLLWSDSFEPVKNGDIIPHLDIVCETPGPRLETAL